MSAPWQAGTRVVLVGLVSAPELNGCTAKVTGFDAAAARFKVTLDDGSEKKVKAAAGK